MRFWKRQESELQNELAHHLHHLRAEYERQGYSPADADRMARREFGGAAQVEEQCRSERSWAWIAGLRQDIVFGLRMMRRTPAVTLAAILSLALGIGANTAVVSLMDIVLWRNLPVPSPRELTLVDWQGHGFPRDLCDGASGSMDTVEGVDVADFFSWPAYMQMRRGVAGIASLAAYSFPTEVSVSFAGRPVVGRERGVSGNFFSAMEVQPKLGRLLTDNDDRYAAQPVVVLSHRFWSRTFGADPGVLGKSIRINNSSYQIAGVLEERFYGLSPGDPTDVYTPMHQASTIHDAFNEKARPLEDERLWGTQVLSRRAAGVSDARLRLALDTIFPSTWRGRPKNAKSTPHIHLEEGAQGLGFLRQEYRNSFRVLGGLVALLLVIACVNIANLLLARAVARRNELAMRVSLGCGRARLIRQFLTESALLAIVGGAASIAVAWSTGVLLGTFIGGRDNLPIEFTPDGRMLATVGAITITALLLFGLFPAWQASRRLDASWLRQDTRTVGLISRSVWNSGRIFATFQMALSVILVMTAVIFTRNLEGIQSTDPGFDRRNLIVFSVRPGTSGYDKARLPQFYSNLEQRMQTTSGVSAAGLARMRPMNIGGWWMTVQLAGETKTFDVSANSVTPSYLPLYTARMIAGRNFNRADTTTEPTVAIISEDLARKMGGNGVLGRWITAPGGPPGSKVPKYQIVGIAPVIAATSMKDKPYVLWVPFAGDAQEATVVLRTSAPPMAVLPAIQRTMSEIDRNVPMVETMTMEEQISRGLQRERMFATLCSGFGVLALVLSVIGLYGVISYSTSRRRGEIGIRLALGARPGNVASMILRQGLALAVPGILLGVPVVWLCGKYLAKELTKMKPVDPLTLFLAPAILLLAALIATAIPAVRASTLDPAETLRQE